MLVQLTSSVCVNDSHIIKMVSLTGADKKPYTSITLRGQYEPLTIKGDWVKKIVKAKQVGAVYLDSVSHTLRS